MSEAKIPLFADQYIAIYEIFWQSILEREFANRVPKGVNNYSEVLFKLAKKDARPFVLWFLEGTNTSDGRYFFRRYDECRRSDKIQFDKLALYNIFVYIGYFNNTEDKLIREVPLEKREKFRTIARNKITSSTIDKYLRSIQKRNVDKNLGKKNKRSKKKEPRILPKDVVMAVPAESAAEYFRQIDDMMRESGYYENDDGTLVPRPPLEKVSDEQFGNSLSRLKEYYTTGKQKPEVEKIYFKGLEMLANKRAYNNFAANYTQDVRKIALQNELKDYFFDIYELKGDKIIKQRICFGYNEDCYEHDEMFEDNDYGFTTTFAYKTPDGKIKTRGCRIDLAHDAILFDLVQSEKYGETVCLPSLFVNHAVGHKVTFNNMILQSWMIVVENGPEKYKFLDRKSNSKIDSQLGYWEMKKYDKRIPEFTRSLLLVPWEHSLKTFPFLYLPFTLFSKFSCFQ